MNIIQTDDFQKALEKLPKEIQQLYFTQKMRFQLNWRDPRSHIKKIRSLQFASSFRITRRYRVFFYFQNSDTAIFFEIGHRKNVYK